MPLDWSPEFYNKMLNLIGGENRGSFNLFSFMKHGWTTSTIFNTPTENDDHRVKLIDILQERLQQLYLLLSMLVHGEPDGKSDAGICKDKESLSLLHSIFRHIRQSEDALDTSRSKHLYALCDLGKAIIKRLTPQQDGLQDSSASVTLPHMLYKSLE